MSVTRGEQINPVLVTVLLAFTMVPGSVWVRPATGRDQVIIGISEEPDVLNPLFAQSPAARSVLATIFTVDVQRDHSWKLFPQGVQSLPSLKNGNWKLRGETMTLLWKLKPRDWHDGTPVTCADFSFAHRVASDPNVRVADRDLTNRVARVDCPKGDGGTEVAVHWRDRFAYAHTMVIDHGALPQHILDPIYRQNPAALHHARFGTDPSSTVGDGAYKFVNWRRGRSMTVEATSYHQIFGTPGIKRIVWRFIADTRALTASMLSGTIDAISTIGISFDQAVQLERQAAGRIKVFFEPGLIWEHIDFNLSNPILADVRVRRALVHAINRDEINRQLFHGKQEISHTYLPPKHPGYTDAIAKYRYDSARARTLLEEAGWMPGSDGILRDMAGRRLSLEINTTAGDRAREQVERIIQKNLRDVGIELTIRNFPARVLFDEMVSRRKFKGLTMYAWALAPTSDCDQLYTSDGIPAEGNGWAGQNYPGYRNREMDRACRAAGQEVDGAARDRLLRETSIIFARDLPAVPLYMRRVVAAAKPGLRNYRAVRAGRSYETWNATRWAWD